MVSSMGRKTVCAYGNQRKSILIKEENSPRKSRKSIIRKEDKSADHPSLFNEVSPEKAMHVAMVKSRFADIIFKATHHILFVPSGQKSDRLKMQQHGEKLKREELKEKNRAAARMKLQKMKRSVDIYENMDILKELEMLSFGSRRTMERLGLYLKKDDDYYMEDDADLEEGEIRS